MFLRYFVATDHFVDHKEEKWMNWRVDNNMVYYRCSLCFVIFVLFLHVPYRYLFFKRRGFLFAADVSLTWQKGSLAKNDVLSSGMTWDGEKWVISQLSHWIRPVSSSSGKLKNKSNLFYGSNCMDRKYHSNKRMILKYLSCLQSWVFYTFRSLNRGGQY